MNDHDFRSHLNALLLAIDDLGSTALQPSQIQKLDEIRDKVLSLTNVVSYQREKRSVYRSIPRSWRPLFGWKVLIVDDDKLSCSSLHALLYARGYDCHYVLHFSDAKKLIQTQTFDALILDYFDPQSTAEKFLSECKTELKIHFHLTALALNSGQQEALSRCGAKFDLCVAKPFSIEMFENQLREAIYKKQSPHCILNAEQIDYYQSSQLLGQLTEIFTTDFPLHLAGARESLQIGDYEKLKYYSHCLLSKSKTIGAQRMTILCLQLEDLLVQEQWSLVSELFNKIENCFHETTQELNRACNPSLYNSFVPANKLAENAIQFKDV